MKTQSVLTIPKSPLRISYKKLLKLRRNSFLLSSTPYCSQFPLTVHWIVEYGGQDTLHCCMRCQCIAGHTHTPTNTQGQFTVASPDTAKFLDSGGNQKSGSNQGSGAVRWQRYLCTNVPAQLYSITFTKIFLTCAIMWSVVFVRACAMLPLQAKAYCVTHYKIYITTNRQHHTKAMTLIHAN